MGLSSVIHYMLSCNSMSSRTGQPFFEFGSIIFQVQNLGLILARTRAKCRAKLELFANDWLGLLTALLTGKKGAI